MIKLKNNRLEVIMLEPNEGPNQKERFDRSAYITDIILDGKYSFCSSEPGELLSHRMTGGYGLVSEIKCDDLGCEAGCKAWFPKFGVGLLYNESGKKYDFMLSYEQDSYDVSWVATELSAEFEIFPKKCMGYALREKRNVKINNNVLVIEYSYTNEGEKALNLDEYVHNFISINRLPIGPAYHLEMPVKSWGEKIVSACTEVYGEKQSIIWNKHSKEPEMFRIEEDDIKKDTPFFWKLWHENCSAWIMEETSFKPSKILVWFVDHIISCECYNSFKRLDITENGLLDVTLI